tara:strand:- start:517 stop:1488 length:972 start_codon:yes stop_codon:yes gene_type:complete
MKKILILGISSFSGASVASYLNNEKYKIIGTYNSSKKINYLLYKNKGIETHKINLLKDEKKLLKLILKIKPEIILDYASICMVNESWKYQQQYFKINVKSRLSIIENFDKMRFLKKYIYISTPEVFGNKKNRLKENYNSFLPSTPYAVSKLMAELNFRNAFNSKKFPIIISRFSNFYGPGQEIYRLIPKIIMSIKKNIKFPLQGSGKSKRNFIFSEDFCVAILKVIKNGKIGEIYHFSGDKFVSINFIIKTICKLLNKNYNYLIKKVKDRVGKDEIYMLDSSFTKKKFKWSSNTTLQKGIKDTILFYEKNYNYLKNKKLNYKI